jgi:hypothetical protein
MLEPLQLLRFSKYGFVTALSAFLAFLSTQNPAIRAVLVYAWISLTALGVMACLWKQIEQSEDEVRVGYLLSLGRKFEVITVLSLITIGVMVGVS